MLNKTGFSHATGYHKIINKRKRFYIFSDFWVEFYYNYCMECSDIRWNTLELNMGTFTWYWFKRSFLNWFTERSSLVVITKEEYNRFVIISNKKYSNTLSTAPIDGK